MKNRSFEASGAYPHIPPRLGDASLSQVSAELAAVLAALPTEVRNEPLETEVRNESLETEVRNESLEMERAPEPVSFATFVRELERYAAASEDFRRLMEMRGGESAEGSASEAAFPRPFTGEVRTGRTRGGTVTRAFWWGFHIQVSHADMVSFIQSAGTVNDQVGNIAGSIAGTGSASDTQKTAGWVALVAQFIKLALGLLRGLDRGRGVYISMSWFLPGIFVPTSV